MKRYEPNDTSVSDMFAELLSRAFDRDRIGEAHPAFPKIISQLSSDEADLLKILKYNERMYGKFTKSYGEAKIRSLVNSQIEEKLVYSDNERVAGYIDHLEALGLIHFFDWEPGEDESVFYVLTSKHIQGHIAFNAFGIAFMDAVLPRK